MKILNWPRQSGKTTFLMKKAMAECMPVLVHSEYIEKMLRKNFDYPYVYHDPDALRGSSLGWKFWTAPWLVDEIALCNVPVWMQVETATTTDREIELEQRKYMTNLD